MMSREVVMSFRMSLCLKICLELYLASFFSMNS